MALVKYIGPAASVNVGGVVCAKGNSIEVSAETATSLLGQAATWEAGNKETEELVPFTPASVLSLTGYQGAWDTRASYVSGEFVSEGSGLYLSLVANTGLKPSTHAGTWLACGGGGSGGQIRAEMLRSSRRVRDMASALPSATAVTIGAKTAATSLSGTPGLVTPLVAGEANPLLRTSNVGVYSDSKASPNGVVAKKEYRPGSTLSAEINVAGGAKTKLPVVSLPAKIPSGAEVTIVSGGNSQTWTLTAEGKIADTELTVTSQTPNASYAAGSAFTFKAPGGQPMRTHFGYDGSAFEIEATNNGAVVRVWVDGLPHQTIPQALAQGAPDGSVGFYLVTLGDRRPREIIIEGEESFRLLGVNIEQTAQITPAPAPVGRVFHVGDSIPAGTGAVLNLKTYLMANWSTQLGRRLGIDDWWQGASCGGTGFLKTNGSGNPPYIQRIDTDVKPYMTSNSIVILGLSSNDESFIGKGEIAPAILACVKHMMEWPTPPLKVILLGLTCAPAGNAAIETEGAEGAKLCEEAYPNNFVWVPTKNNWVTGNGTPVAPLLTGNGDFFSSYKNAPHPNLFGVDYFAVTGERMLAPILGVQSDNYSPRPYDLTQPTVGVEPIPRLLCTGVVAQTSKAIRLTYFQAQRHMAIGKARMATKEPIASGLTTAQMALFLVGGSGYGDTNLTVVQNESTALSAEINVAGGAITTLPVTAIPAALISGSVVAVVAGANIQLWTLTAEAAAKATSLTVASQTPNATYASGSAVNLAAVTPNNTALFGEANTETPFQTFSPPSVELLAGQWYAFAILQIGTTPGSVTGSTGTNLASIAGGSNRPRLGGTTAATFTAMPATIASGSVTNSNAVPYALLAP